MNFEFDLTVTLSLISSLGVALFAWFRTRRQDVDERFEGAGQKLGTLDQRMTSLEQTVAALPEKDDIHRMELAMTGMAGKMDVIATHMAGQKDVMKRLENVVTRHEDHLLKGGR